jgi:class 3 adenylate cyclase/DNA-binding winged helix-turn-helix (wHTH) protein/tetratricopeptide (TPR) repeat protein
MASPQWLFGGFRLDPDNACLWHGAQAIALTPKAFDVLHYLVTHPDRVVTKDTLLDAAWPETAISDTVVRIAIGELRRVLGDTARAPRFIATVHRRGYRFLAPVTVVAPPEPAPGEEPPRHTPLAPFPQGALPSGPALPAPPEDSTTWRCAVCQHPLSRAARFCVACGAPVAEMCLACGQMVLLPATFCPGCGHRLEALPPTQPAPHAPLSLAPPVALPERGPLAYTPVALVEKIRTSRAALAGERKQVTVLFADLKDSLELIRRLDPEAAQQLLDPALHRMMDAVHRYEGTVNQVLGDGIMALFGAPIAHEDHAARACYAALAMQAALGAYAAEVRRTHSLTRQSRIGLNSGEVVVRIIHNDLHMEYSAVGPTTHLAARMEQVALPDTVLLTATTMRLVEGLMRVKAWGPVPVRGVTEPMEVWELLGVHGRRRRLQTARARGLTRFVGRQTELALLEAALAQAGAGHGQVVAVVGEAGVGKSRLVDEFVQVAHMQGWLVLDSAAMSYGQATPYFPVRDLLCRYCHLEEGADADTIQAQVTEQVRTLDTALQDTVPALLALLDALPADSPFLQLDAPQRRQRTLVALKQVLLRQSQVQPLLLVCEDLHWLDTETQALLDSLGESLPMARLLLLVNYRPDYRHGWGSKTYYTQVRLGPLPPASADAFLQALVGDDPSLAPLAQLLIQRTEGNPFFLEESVRTLVETGVLEGEPGAYLMVHTLPTIEVPATVQAVLAARLDRVPPEEKRLLQTMAVIGMEVPLALLQAVEELSEEALQLGLAHLQDAEFLYETRLFPELVYTFKHALTQEVAYGSLLHERRRVLHARIVEALEALAGHRVVEHVDRLAHHAVRGEMWAKALAYCRQAGEKALMRSAHREAVGYFEQALRVLPHLPETRATREQAIDLRLALRTALFPSGDFGRILAYLHEAETLAAELDDPRRLGQVSVFLSVHCCFGGAYDRAMAAGQRALALATASDDVVLHALANQYLGIAYHAQGDYRRAIDCLGQTVASLDGARSCEHHGQVNLPVVLSRTWLAWCHAELGRFAEGRALGEEGLRIAEAVEHPASLAIATWGIGLLALRQGDLPRALPLLEQATRLCQDADLSLFFPWMAAVLGVAYTLGGRVTDAVPLLTQTIEPVCTMKIGVLQVLRGLCQGEVQMLVGRLEDAHVLAEHALALVRTQKERGHQAYALRLLGEIAARHDPPKAEPAEAYYREALALAEELGMRPLVAHCHRGLGTLYGQMEQIEEARAALSTAIALYRAMEMPFWLLQAEAALAQTGAQS